jgi:hypothetical protein
MTKENKVNNLGLDSLLVLFFFFFFSSSSLFYFIFWVPIFLVFFEGEK